MLEWTFAVRVLYHLSQRGINEAIRRGLPDQTKQEIVLPDPYKKTLELPEYSVDEQGFPIIQLVTWTIVDRLLAPKRATLDTPIQNIEEVIEFSSKTTVNKKELLNQIAKDRDKVNFSEN